MRTMRYAWWRQRRVLRAIVVLGLDLVGLVAVVLYFLDGHPLTWGAAIFISLINAMGLWTLFDALRQEASLLTVIAPGFATLLTVATTLGTLYFASQGYYVLWPAVAVLIALDGFAISLFVLALCDWRRRRS